VDPEPTAEGTKSEHRQPRWRLHGPRLLLGVGLAVLTFALFPESPATQIPIYEVGAVAPDNVIAPFAYDVPKSDAELARERNEVARAAEPIFRHVPAALDTTRELLSGFEVVIATAAAARPQNLAIERAARVYAVTLSPEEAAYLAFPARRQRLLAAVRAVFDRWVTSGVVSTGAIDRLRGEVLLHRGEVEDRLPVDSLLSFGQLISRARLFNPDPGSEAGTALYLKLITSFFRPTITFDRTQTERRLDELRRSVPAGKYSVRAGEKIVGAHEVVGREEHDKLRALQQTLGEHAGAQPRIRRAVGSILFDLAILILLGVTLYFFRPQVYAHWRSVVVLIAPRLPGHRAHPSDSDKG